MGLATLSTIASVADGGSPPLRICFVMLQALGLATLSANLRASVAGLDSIQAGWIETVLWKEGGLLERLPGVPSYVRAGVRGLQDVRRALREAPCDVLVFNPQNAAAFCQWYMLRIPTILLSDATPMQHDQVADLYGHVPDRNPVERLIKHRVNVLNYRLARAVVPWSNWVRASLIRDYGVPPERTHVIPPGVDLERWRPADGRPASDKVQLLFVGGDLHRKGGHVLLDAFRGLRLNDRAELHIVTRDPVEPSPGVVVHYGLTSNTPELMVLYRRTDAFVLPTLADFSPLALVEATASGLPVISTTVGGIADIIDDGRTGLLVPPGDARALRAALERLVADSQLRARLGAAGRQRAVTHFDAHANARRILELAVTIHAAALASGGSPTRR